MVKGLNLEYYPLGSTIPEFTVAAGDEETLGQEIGCVGTSALLESALGSHLHFAVTYQDEPMDPAEFLALGQE